MKVGDMEGVRKLIRIECSCGAVWIRYGKNKYVDKRERQYFIAKHGDHDLKRFEVTSTLSKAR